MLNKSKHCTAFEEISDHSHEQTKLSIIMFFFPLSLLTISSRKKKFLKNSNWNLLLIIYMIFTLFIYVTCEFNTFIIAFSPIKLYTFIINDIVRLFKKFTLNFSFSVRFHLVIMCIFNLASERCVEQEWFWVKK